MTAYGLSQEGAALNAAHPMGKLFQEQHASLQWN